MTLLVLKGTISTSKGEKHFSASIAKPEFIPSIGLFETIVSSKELFYADKRASGLNIDECLLSATELLRIIIHHHLSMEHKKDLTSG